jgi:hypothetical protein
LQNQLHFFINKCIDVSIFPDKLKTAQVRPLFKKNNILEKGNYRPVSVLPTISTFVERAIFDQLTDFFKFNLFICLLTKSELTGLKFRSSVIS